MDSKFTNIMLALFFVWLGVLLVLAYKASALLFLAVIAGLFAAGLAGVTNHWSEEWLWRRQSFRCSREYWLHVVQRRREKTDE